MGRRAGSDGQRTAAAIRAAALRLIARHGYVSLSMRCLAEEVDLAAAALYRYFPNKQSILVDLLKAHMTGLLAARAGARLPEGRSAPAQVEAFTRFHIRHHLPRRDAVFPSCMELRSLEPGNFARIEALRRSYERDLIAILEAGAGERNLEVTDARVTARAIIATLTGITTWYRPGGALGIGEIERIYLRLVAGMVGLPAQREVSCSMPA